MLTPAIFERQMLEYEEISNEIMESEEKDPERARKTGKGSLREDSEGHVLRTGTAGIYSRSESVKEDLLRR